MQRKKKSRLDTRDFLQKSGLQSKYLLGFVPELVELVEPAGLTQPNRVLLTLPHSSRIRSAFPVSKLTFMGLRG